MKAYRLLVLAFAAAALLGGRAARAEDIDVKAIEADGGTVDANGDVHFPFDKGPDTIDVSKYPQEQQDNYQVFAEKCSKCHTLARPINSPFALPEEWSAYVTKMQHKKRSGIDEDAAKKISSFLTYDSAIRKKDAIEKKLKDKKAADGKKDSDDKKDADDKKGADKDKAAPAPEKTQEK